MAFRASSIGILFRIAEYLNTLKYVSRADFCYYPTNKNRETMGKKKQKVKWSSVDGMCLSGNDEVSYSQCFSFFIIRMNFRDHMKQVVEMFQSQSKGPEEVPLKAGQAP